MDYEIIHQPEQKLFKTEVDGRTAFVQYRLLGDSLDIIHTIVPRPIEGRGIGRSYAKSFRPCDGTDNRQMSAALLLEIRKSGIHHAGESLYIGACRIQFHFHIQFHVLEADAGTKKKQVHATRFVYERVQFFCRIFSGDVQCLNFNFINSANGG